MVKRFEVQGMSCQHCKQSIESALSKLKGVNQVNAYFREGYVDVDFEEDLVKSSEIAHEIEELGFEVTGS